MNSPLTALVWEIWRRGRRSAWLAAGCVTLCTLMNWLAPERMGTSQAGQAVYGILMVFSFLFLMGIFNYTEFNSTRDWNGFPYRLFVLPVRTWQLVAVPMALGLAATELLYLAWIKLVWNHPNDVAKPEWFAVVLGGYMIVYQTTLWAMAGYRIMRIVVLSLGGVSSIVVACLPFSGESQPSPWLSAERLMKVIILTAVAAFVLAWAAASRQRHGGGRQVSRLATFADWCVDRLPGRTSDFASPAAAQFWYEWRRAGWVLPACAMFVLLIIIGPLTWMFRANPDFASDALLKIVAMPLVLGLVVGKAFVKPEFWSIKLSFPSHLAVRPLAAGEFVVSKMKVAALSVAITWLGVFGFVALWLRFWANTRQVALPWYEFSHQLYPHSWLAIVILLAGGLMLLTWRCLVDGFWAGLSGRPAWYLGATGLQMITPVLLLILCSLWWDQISLQILRHPPQVLALAGWLLAVAVILKMSLAVLSWSNITNRRARQYLLVGSGVVLWFVVLGILSPSEVDDPYRPEHFIILAAFLLCPLARLGIAPMAFAANRHAHGGRFWRPVNVSKYLLLVAVVVSGAALVLAMDPGHPDFKYIDAGGHPVRMLFLGQGAPTVVFESGRRGSVGAPLEMWSKVQPAVSQFARTVAYDQSSVGLSAPGPWPHDALQNARELHTALQNASSAPPYILVGHSFGGPFIRVFASLYPAEVAGLVLVDPTQEEFIYWDEHRHPNDFPAADWEEIKASLAQAHDSRVPAGIPVVLITGMGPRVFPSFVTEKERSEYRADHQMWLKFHAEWLKTVPQGRHIITENSGHDVPFTEPELVINAIRQMVEQVRNQGIVARQNAP